MATLTLFLVEQDPQLYNTQLSWEKGRRKFSKNEESRKPYIFTVTKQLPTKVAVVVRCGWWKWMEKGYFGHHSMHQHFTTIELVWSF